MSKQFLLLELSREPSNTISGNPQLIDVIVEISHPENLESFKEPCKDRNVVNANPELCNKIASWLRLFGFVTILDKSDQDDDLALCLELCDGGRLIIEGWKVLGQAEKDALIENNVFDPEFDDSEDDLKAIYEFTDSLTLSKSNQHVENSVFIATRNSYSSNFDLVLECKFDKQKQYDLYEGKLGVSTINVLLSDVALLPSVVAHKSTLGEEYYTCNALELFKDSLDAYNVETEHVDSFVQLDVSKFETTTINMDFIELQASIHSNQMFAFMGNDPAN